MKHRYLAILAALSWQTWAAEYLSPEYLAVAPDGQTLYMSAATADCILRYDLRQESLLPAITLRNTAQTRSGFLGFLRGSRTQPGSASPSGIAVNRDGQLFVSGGGAQGFLQQFTPDGKLHAQVSVGHTPMAPTLSSDGTRIYLLERFDNQVRVLNSATLESIATIPVLREPHACALGTDGRLLFVANHLPYCRATNDIVAASISVIDTATASVLQHVMLPNGSTGVRGLCASADGRDIYVTHTFGRYQLPTTQLERGWMNTAGLSILDGTSGNFVNTVLLDDIDLGAANPWGVAVSPDNRHIVVAHAGTHELSLINRTALHERLARVARNEKVTEVSRKSGDVPNDLSFLVDLRQRISLTGNGPHGVIISGNTAYTALYYSEAFAVLDLAAPRPQARTVQLRDISNIANDQTRYGEILWNDATMCFQHWQSCASCHPDARTDALNWDLLNDGIGNPKQTKSIVYTHLTPPVMVTGIRPDFHACNRKGLTHIQFVVRPESDAECIDAYTISLKPEPSPYLINGRLSPRARRGQKLFTQVGCIHCHPDTASGPNGEQLFTNLQTYDLKLGIGNEEGRHFDTPTLIEVWRTAPYLYDGRALTMQELLTTDNPHNTHGKTQGLSAAEVEDLVEYVLSL